MMDVVAVARRFVREAAVFAMEARATMEIGCKEGDIENVVTNVDLAISAMAQEILAPFLAAGDVLIDEENLPEGALDGVFAHKGRLWVIDPIDGTQPFSEGKPYWGVILAVYEGGRPVFAGISLPALGKTLEILPAGVYVDGDMVAAGGGGDAIVNISRRAMGFLPVAEVAGFTNNRVLSAALMTYNLAAGESCLAAMPAKASVWDVAPIMMLAAQWGLVAFYPQAPREMLSFEAGMFEDDWHLRDILVVATREVYGRLYPVQAKVG